MKRGVIGLTIVVLAAAALMRAADTLDIYFIDTEGGQATLLVTPAGQTMLIDSAFADIHTDIARHAPRLAPAPTPGHPRPPAASVPTHSHRAHLPAAHPAA